ncbi:hypothetical protein ACIQFU_36655 [Streptomyces sp. NPDC093065]|uniref:hypothetical protein n=1 Tax=Streptomyces sp. NPDC093065 TaxID=3366021 RepID=UPI0038008E37
MPLPRLLDMWATVLGAAGEAGRDPAALRIVLRVNVELTDLKAGAEDIPRRGTLSQYVDYARAAAEAGVHELFVDFGQHSVTLGESVDLAGRFLTGVREG